MVEPTPAAGSLTRPCVKCRTQEAALESRSQPVCKDCFLKFVAGKFIKQIGILGKDVRPPPPPPSTTGNGPHTGIRRYLLGLSLGLSSTVLLHLLNENVDFILAKGRGAPFELVVVHVDTSSSNAAAAAAAAGTTDHDVLAQYRERYPRFEFHSVPLSTSESPSSPSDPSSTTTATPPAPATAGTSRASTSDITTHLTRRTLLAQTHAHNCQALLLGHSTTALAALTLAEAAKGRGFAVPWLVGDGPVPGRLGLDNGNDDDKPRKPKAPILIHHPLRDALRKELLLYARLVNNPPLTALLHPSDPDSLSSTTTGENDSAAGATKPRPAVISHRDLSIEDVMTRYFADVEENYPSVVANVARTTGKLVRGVGAGAGAEGGSKEEEEEEEEECGLCGMPLDGDGDERWRGELGIQERGLEGVSARWGRLCYGCERSTAG
ncbi:hypothetical protein B0J18DRAFT_478911 [Chaetomium sp. MPI-SDFR-AT-0129]|nr:hypothetical protein B0J18DRAFT_478911 [Chaetomium sp. MPI-SDFR-AT-0129]